jgi:hypothetical protein
LNYAPTVHVQAASEQQIGLAVTNALEQHSDALSREIQRKSEMQGSIELHK